tara:strand:- start:10144 stop:11916 length:1773 start_codon:yes stop_codon:yes gene_type:complete
MIQFTRSIYELIRGKLFKVLFYLIIGGFFEGFALLLLVPILNFTMRNDVPSSGILLILDNFLSGLDINFSLGLGLLIFFFVFVLQTIFYLLREYSIADTIAFARMNIRRNLYGALLKSEWVYIVKKKRGELVSAVVNDSEKAGNAIYSYLIFISSLTISSVYTVTAIIIAPTFTIAMISIALILFLLLKKTLKRGSDFGQISSEGNSQLQIVLNEHFDAMKLVKGTALFDLSENSVKNAAKRLADIERKVLKHNAKLKSYSEPVIIALLTFSIYFAITFLKINIAELFVVLLIFLRLFPKIINLNQMYFQLMVYIPSYDKVLYFTMEALKHVEKTFASHSKFNEVNRGIEIKNISFEYNPNAPVINEFSLSIKKGEAIAITGESGSGKSTLTDLILGLIKPTSGLICIDDQPINEINLIDYRNKIGYVSQETILIHDTVKNNILWGKTGSVNDKQFKEICKLSHVDEFVKKMPENYDTIIGDKGTMLSGGQRQRLAIARALARKPEILILDEATSSLDSESERLIQKSIDSLSGEISIIIIIAHRLSTVVNADKIIVLENGSILESGNFEELMKINGSFKSIYNMQTKGG